ncbi:MAG: EAL domain-containing protein [Rhizobiaceae bacterium]
MKKYRSDIPDDVYLEYVRSLYNDAATVLVGAGVHATLAALAYAKTGQPSYLAIAITLAAVGLLRYFGIRRVDPATQITDIQSAKAHERDHVFRAGTHGLVLGLFSFNSIFLFPDEFAEIASVSVSMATMISVVGRNYASSFIVRFLAFAIVLPIALGLMLKGDLFHAALGLMIVPFYTVTVKMAEHVREVLTQAVNEHAAANLLAHRFNTALNTMGHGLIMLDAQGLVVVSNREAANLLTFPNAAAMEGRSLSALLLRCVAGNLLSREEYRSVHTQLTRALREGRDGKVLVAFANGRYFEFSAREGREELGVITFEDVTSRIEAEKQIRHMARFDSLTGLPNRAHFHEIVTSCLMAGERSRMCAMAIVDLDDFKQVNDSLGHPVGDGLIYAVADRLNRFASPSVKVSRFGGDEFMIYFDDIANERDLSRRFDEIFAEFADPIEVAGHSLTVQISIGTAVSLAFAAEVDAMIVKADLALYKVKETGKDGWMLFAPEMDSAFRERQTLKAELRKAIERGELRAVYQPIIDMKTMKISTCEALSRWTHAELGTVSPAVFIPLAEEMGIVSAITAVVLKTACTECAKWPGEVSVSVNLSAVDFRNRDIIGVVVAALKASGLPASRLEVEVTETALMNDQTLTRSILSELKAMGVCISLDDFGTGYSNLSYVHSLPLDKLKIDQSFLSEIDTSKRSLDLLQATIHLARSMGLAVTVEGVETWEHLNVMSSTAKPDYVQGFVFGPPLPAAAIADMVVSTMPFSRETLELQAHG